MRQQSYKTLDIFLFISGWSETLTHLVYFAVYEHLTVGKEHEKIIADKTRKTCCITKVVLPPLECDIQTIRYLSQFCDL